MNKPQINLENQKVILKKSSFLLRIVHLLPYFLQKLLLQIGFLQRSQTYITNMPGMMQMLSKDGNEFSGEFQEYINQPNSPLAKTQSLFLKMANEERLHLLYLPPANGKIICAFHGIKGNWFDNPYITSPSELDDGYNPQYRMELLNEFAADGFGFVAFTLPGFNPSGGVASERNFNEACEVFADYIIKLGISPENIIVCGESLGGAAAAIFARKMTEKSYPPAVLSLIATFDSLVGMTHNEFPNFSYGELEKLLTEKLDTTKIFEHLDNKKTYLHIVATEDDCIIPIRNTHKLLEAARHAKNGSFNILFHLISGKHTTWNKTEVLNSKKIVHMARQRSIEIAEYQTVKDIENILSGKVSPPEFPCF